MLRYRLTDHRIIEGRTWAQLVEAMRANKLIPTRSRAAYRRATSARVLNTYGVDIDDTSDEAFVRDLVDAGLLVEEPAK